MSAFAKELKSAAKAACDWVSDSGGAVGFGFLVWAGLRWIALPVLGFSPPAGIGAGEILAMLGFGLTVATVYRRNRRDA